MNKFQLTSIFLGILLVLPTGFAQYRKKAISFAYSQDRDRFASRMFKGRESAENKEDIEDSDVSSNRKSAKELSDEKARKNVRGAIIFPSSMKSKATPEKDKDLGSRGDSDSIRKDGRSSEGRKGIQDSKNLKGSEKVQDSVNINDNKYSQDNVNTEVNQNAQSNVYSQDSVKGPDTKTFVKGNAGVGYGGPSGGFRGSAGNAGNFGGSGSIGGSGGPGGYGNFMGNAGHQGGMGTRGNSVNIKNPNKHGLNFLEANILGFQFNAGFG